MVSSKVSLKLIACLQRKSSIWYGFSFRRGRGFDIKRMPTERSSRRKQVQLHNVSEAAVRATCSSLAAHNVNADVVVADLVSGLEKQLSGTVDVLVFNPPYVPTSEDEVGVDGITSARAGGDRGRQVIDRMLSHVDSLLSSKGIFYLVTGDRDLSGDEKEGFWLEDCGAKLQ